MHSSWARTGHSVSFAWMKYLKLQSSLLLLDQIWVTIQLQQRGITLSPHDASNDDLLLSR